MSLLPPALPSDLYLLRAPIEPWFGSDEMVMPWDLPALGCHGRPVEGWDPDTLDRAGW